MSVVSGFLDHPYFARPAPKSLDRDAFIDLQRAVGGMSTEDALATLSAAVVESVAAGFALCPTAPQRLLVTGGGRNNATLMTALAQRLPCLVMPVEAVGLNGDMLEAQAFAYLAVRVARGLPISAPATTGVPRPLVGGRMSHPDAAT